MDLTCTRWDLNGVVNSVLQLGLLSIGRHSKFKKSRVGYEYMVHVSSGHWDGRGKFGITKMCSVSVHSVETVVQMPSDQDVEPQFPEELDRSLLPKHVAIIMDGNSRWAERRGWPATRGHEAGVRALKEIVKLAESWGIEVLTVFAFSTENWLRPKVKPHTNAIKFKDYGCFW